MRNCFEFLVGLLRKILYKLEQIEMETDIAENDHLSRLTKNAIDHNEAVVVKTIIDTIVHLGEME